MATNNEKGYHFFLLEKGRFFPDDRVAEMILRKCLMIFCATALVLTLLGLGRNPAEMDLAARDQSERLERTVAAGDIPLYRCEVVGVYPHDPQAFTQGLLFKDGFLYESTGLRSRSTLRQVELETGRILRAISLPEALFAEGLALHGDRLFQLTWTAGTALVYKRGTFEKISEFRYQGEGWGLTGDGRNLIMSDGSSHLVFRDPETFLPLRQITIRAGREPVAFLNELEYVAGEIFANIYHSDYIARIDPISGEVTGWIDARSLPWAENMGTRPGVLNGIAFDSETGRLFLTGKRWPSLLEVRLVSESSE